MGRDDKGWSSLVAGLFIGASNSGVGLRLEAVLAATNEIFI